LEAVAVHGLPRAPKGDTATRERALQAADAGLAAALAACDPIELLYERASLWSVAGLEAARAREIPTVLEVNAPLVDEQAEHRELVDRAAAEAIVTRQAAAATVLAAVSLGVADHLRARHPEAVTRIHVVPNGVDPVRFGAPATPDPERPFTVGFVGTLKPWHGLEVLVEAFARAHDQLPEARLLVVGDGPGRACLERDLASRGLTAAAELTGAVAPDAVPALLARMDASTAPYPAHEPFYFSPLKVVESMAAGVCVVVSRVGELATLVEDGHTGRLVAPGDPAALGAALVALGRDAAARGAMAAAGRRAVLEHRTWDAVVERVLDLAFEPAGSGRR